MLLVVGFFGSLIEVMLMAFVGGLVDMMRASPRHPHVLRRPMPGPLIGMAFVALIARPGVSAMHDLVKNQMITANLTGRHPLADAYLRAAPVAGLLPERFRRPHFDAHHADGPGAAEIRRAGCRRHLVHGRPHRRRPGDFLGGAISVSRCRCWPGSGSTSIVLRIFVPRIQKLSTEASEARSWLTGRVVDSYTNMPDA